MQLFFSLLHATATRTVFEINVKTIVYCCAFKAQQSVTTKKSITKIAIARNWLMKPEPKSIQQFYFNGSIILQEVEIKIHLFPSKARE